MGVHLQRAMVLFEQSRFDLAEKEVQQELAQEPESPFAHALLARCLVERKEYTKATDAAQQAVTFGPNLAYAQFVLGRVYLERNFYDEAAAAALEAIRIDSDDPDYFALLAAIRLEQRNWPDALAATETGLRLDAEHVDCANLRAVALVKLGRKDEAGITIDAALQRDPENAYTHANQGWALLEKSQPEKAMEHFREALRLEPNMEWARQGIVEALKARHFIYGLMLRYFLWLAKFGQKGQWFLILGGWFGIQILRRTAAQNPAIAPYATPIIICYVAFVLMSWLAYPLFNLLLRFNRFGRLALSADQVLGSNFVGACLLLCAACFGLSYLWPNSPLDIAWMMFGLLLLPTAGTFVCEKGWPRYVMGGVALALLVIGLFGLSRWWTPATPANVALFKNCITINFWGCALSTFLCNFLANATVKKY